jgi:hypothetical protein
MRPAFLFLAILTACGVDSSNVVGNDETAQGSDALASPVPPIFFNHTFGVMSAATVNALQTNTWLNNEFIDVEMRTTVRPDITYTGTYLNMRETYLEFFADGVFYGSPIGVTGIGLGDEATGGIQKIVVAWQKEFGATEAYQTKISRTVNNVSTPWFELAGMSWSDNSAWTSAWGMEYEPDPGQSAPRTRHEERSVRYAPGKLAQNVLAAIYGLPLADRQNLRRSMKAAGLLVTGDDNHFIALSAWDHGTRRVWAIQPDATGRRGLLGLVLQMNRYVHHTEQLGDAVLEAGVAGLPIAALWFVPPTAADHATASALAQ